ncbi:MAG: lytic murein transglycosylase B [Cycloclasticus sp. symbiont of Poecilosclerida sp. M]|nr:MAG: lytic murein transglycosylase B [Cycloclasticus sp. symbiont of Poecilosclerida sp. M]
MLFALTARGTTHKPIPVEPALTKNVGLHHAFINKMVEQHKFDRDELTAILEKSELQPRILEAMTSPAEHRLEWHQYRKIFLKKARIDGGVKFWKKNKQLLEQASKKYGVPAEIIVAIIGVETRYGGNVGYHRVLDALVTLGFHFPRRTTFFQSELEHFLLLCREEGFNPLELQGSYAGAMGQSQFIASSYRAYAVDGDNDNKRDLWDSPADIIYSVAHYFSKHGWKTGKPITQQTKVKGEDYRNVITGSLKPRHTLQNLASNQVNTPTDLPPNTSVKLLELTQAESLEYWLAFHNFYVITRYNHSQLYAMAAYQLSVEIKKKMLQP